LPSGRSPKRTKRAPASSRAAPSRSPRARPAAPNAEAEAAEGLGGRDDHEEGADKGGLDAPEARLGRQPPLVHEEGKSPARAGVEIEGRLVVPEGAAMEEEAAAIPVPDDHPAHAVARALLVARDARGGPPARLEALEPKAPPGPRPPRQRARPVGLLALEGQAEEDPVPGRDLASMARVSTPPEPPLPAAGDWAAQGRMDRRANRQAEKRLMRHKSFILPHYLSSTLIHRST
jgi:hypothetical protein